MKKTAKKLLCLAAVLALSVSLLTGCQDKEPYLNTPARK